MELNFTTAKIDPLKMYGGANGNKIGVLYQGETYMLKFPPAAKKNPEMSYSNSCVSEYVACHIFELLGFETQKTLLVRYRDKIAVACKDFERDGFLLKDFAHLKNTVIGTAPQGAVFSILHRTQSPERCVLSYQAMGLFDAPAYRRNAEYIVAAADKLLAATAPRKE